MVSVLNFFFIIILIRVVSCFWSVFFMLLVSFLCCFLKRKWSYFVLGKGNGRGGRGEGYGDGFLDLIMCLSEIFVLCDYILSFIR